MPTQSVVERLRLARDALVLVSRGNSERLAVSRIALADPQLEREKSSALQLVVNTVSELDVLDRAILSIFPGVEIDRRSRALFRLSTHLMLTKKGLSKSDLVKALRKISSNGESARFEQLIGHLVANEPSDHSIDTSEEERVGLRTHNPPWWVSYCFYHFGRETGLKILATPTRPRYVRVNPLRNRGRTSVPSGFAKPSSVFAEAVLGVYRLVGSLSQLSKYFENGLFQVQDLASFLAVQAATPAPGEDVLDLCAAPGGKTANLAQIMKNRGQILSVDYSEARMASWTREIERLGVRIASPLVQDASNLGLKGDFDLILVDPPCTGTGILDRNPRMKWHLSPKLVKKFSLIQTKMLEEASQHTRPGGRILYCTCSITLEENEFVVSKFLTDHPDFESRPTLTDYGSPGLRGQSNCRRFFSYKDGTAGYFIARLERIIQE